MTDRDPVPIVQILKAARAHIARPGGWCRWAAARDKAGRNVPVYDGVRFCAVGAMLRAEFETRATPDEAQDAFECLRMCLPPAVGSSVTHYNDRKNRRRVEIVALYDRAIARAEAVEELKAEGGAA